jgi:hypothetical protein
MCCRAWLIRNGGSLHFSTAWLTDHFCMWRAGLARLLHSLAEVLPNTAEGHNRQPASQPKSTSPTPRSHWHIQISHDSRHPTSELFRLLYRSGQVRSGGERDPARDRGLSLLPPPSRKRSEASGGATPRLHGGGNGGDRSRRRRCPCLLERRLLQRRRGLRPDPGERLLRIVVD